MSSALKQPGTAIEDSAGKDNQVRSDQKLVTEVPADQSKLAAALRGEVTKTGTPKVNYKQINFTRPLYEGWVRELVWRNEEKKEGEVFYYTPQTVNEPRNKIKNDGELEAYLITSGSLFPTNFFSQILVFVVKVWYAVRFNKVIHIHPCRVCLPSIFSNTYLHTLLQL